MAQLLVWVVKSRVLPYILAIALILGVGFWIRHNGYLAGVSDTTAEYEAKIAEEKSRVQKANQAAQEKARKVENELRTMLSEKNAKISVLLQQASKDPDADRGSIGISGVRRINQIR